MLLPLLLGAVGPSSPSPKEKQEWASLRLTAPQVGNGNDGTAVLELFPLRALCWGPSVHYLTQFQEPDSCPATVPHITEETVGLRVVRAHAESS